MCSTACAAQHSTCSTAGHPHYSRLGDSGDIVTAPSDIVRICRIIHCTLAPALRPIAKARHVAGQPVDPRGAVGLPGEEEAQPELLGEPILRAQGAQTRRVPPRAREGGKQARNTAWQRWRGVPEVPAAVSEHHAGTWCTSLEHC